MHVLHKYDDFQVCASPASGFSSYVRLWLAACLLTPSVLSHRRGYYLSFFLIRYFFWFLNRLTLRPCCRCWTAGLGIGVGEWPREGQWAGLVPAGAICHAAQPGWSRVGAGDHGGDVVPETGDGVTQQEGSNQVRASKDVAVSDITPFPYVEVFVANYVVLLMSQTKCPLCKIFQEAEFKVPCLKARFIFRPQSVDFL